MHVVLVIRVWDDDAARPTEPGREADEDGLRARGDETVEQILSQVAVDLSGRDRSAQVPVEPRVVDIHVEAVLMGDVLVHPAAVAEADVPDDHARGAGCAVR